ncbi:MAG: hypothetical protein A2X49_17170 [Lentisphaerae bacterium GWF2_52_8]|nr:MAG: hypothetical protein A2X49_17170 [Lentisphaerae bacterium GWF2_52_8]
METKTGKSETVSSQLLDYIGKEGMRPGDTLPSEDSLAKMFEVSRVSIREAMRGLKFLGMLEARPRRGTVIANVNFEMLSRYIGFQLACQPMAPHELLQARCAIEVGCLATFQGRIAEEACQRLVATAKRALCDSCSKEASAQGLMADLEFHSLLLKEIGNPALMAFSSLLERFFLQLKATRSLESRKRAIKEHCKIAKLLRDGKGLEASKIMRLHLANHMKTYSLKDSI